MNKSTILKAVISNGKSIVLIKNDWNNCHIAIWDGTDVNAYTEKTSLPINFNMTCSYGTDENNAFLLAKFNKVVTNSKMLNWKNIKA